MFKPVCCIQNLMRKKEAPSKSIKNKTTGSQVKKTSSKPRPKTKEPKQQQFFILLGDQFYVAASKTERKTYHLYEEKIKASPPTTSTTPVHTANNSNQNLDLREYVKSLSKAQKQQLFHDLERDIQQQKEQSVLIESQRNEDKLFKLKLKLQGLKEELMAGWEEQINRINHLFENQQISLEEKHSKIRLIEKIRQVKLGMIDSTGVLFDKIMREDSEVELNKQEQLEHIINSLNSMSSLGDPSEPMRRIEMGASPFEMEARPFEMEARPFEADVPTIAVSEILPLKLNEDEQLNNILGRHELEQIPQIPHVQSIEQEQAPQIFTKQTLKLEIRLDQVEFGKDHYDVIEEQDKKQIKEAINIQEVPQVLDEDKVKEQQSDRVEEESNEQKGREEKKKLEEDFLCVDEQSDNKIKIPLLMTKDRLEQLQLQKSSRQIQTLNIFLKNRHAYQVSEVPPDTPEHFTTLLDINNFVVSFYEFIMQRFLKEVIEGLNLAYGKSALDKLFQLRNEGYVPDYDNNSILPEELLAQYHKEVMLSDRRIPQFQKLHNKVVFQAFNAGLNVYRPYYELEGEVFPWNTSEKGLTFYEINEENIEEVFQKSKMKVLEYCASLCGIMPGCELTTSESLKMLGKRNDQSYDRVLKGEITQKFCDWYLKILNFDALARLSICQQIIEHEIELFLQELGELPL